MTVAPDRDELATRYVEQLPYEPYAVQEEALLAWFTSDEGVLVCAPTGTGKTLIAEAALFEALHNGTVAYYTTPLIALTEQKFRELTESAERWGFRADDVGLVTGNRRVNPGARILVVVAEILFNRLLHTEAFDFSQVSAVVMDEFHSFNDPERGMVWELSLGLLPRHIRLLLLSATVGNSREFANWLDRSHRRRLELVESTDRKVPLTYQWVGDQLLTEHVEQMATGPAESRFTPALVFCFNREECWNVAEQLKGKKLLLDGQQQALARALDAYDWSQGAGPKLRQVLQRGVGVHHAGILPRYKRIVEELFQQKLLAVTVCTETLSAGINLPARSVVLPDILKGPPGRKKVIDASTAHQIFGRAGRPQFDTRGFVFVLAHEDDVKIQRWREKYDAIPEDTKDPNLRRAKKAMKKKMPTRRATQQYWTEDQFEKLKAAPPARLASRGHLPWRLLAYMLDASPDVELVRQLVSKRLMDGKGLDSADTELDRMLMTLWAGGYVTLDPPPPSDSPDRHSPPTEDASGAVAEPYRVRFAHPTPDLSKLLLLRGVNPLYGAFLANHLGIADRCERIQALESVMDMTRSVAGRLRVPSHEELPPGPLATTFLDPCLLQRGLATIEELAGPQEDEEPDSRRRAFYEEERPRVLTLAEKLRLLFNADYPFVYDIQTQPVWCAGELIEYGGDFNTYVTAKRLQRQEGVVFRHLLRLILLITEFHQLAPPEMDPELWRGELDEISRSLIGCCRQVDPTSTDKALEQAASDGE